TIVGRMGKRAARRERYALFWSSEHADRRAGIGFGNDASHIFERDVARSGFRRINLDADSKFLRPINQHLRDTWQLRNLRRQNGLRVVIDCRERHGVRTQADVQYREVAWVHLAK